MENGFKGSGLGLAIARSLMALHGGALRIRSHVGVGTIAMLSIPAATKASAQAARSPSLAPRGKAAPGRHTASV
jgi:two-component system cell cycle sensor histidine kinase PleC